MGELAMVVGATLASTIAVAVYLKLTGHLG